MKKLIEQILKFGVVGIICFFIDYLITAIPPVLLGNNDLIYPFAFLGFLVSCIVNYLLSIKYVFTQKKEMDKRKEFIVFVVLSAIGLLINEGIIYLCYDVIYKNVSPIRALIPEKLITTVSKIIATGIVMIYNFISRKLFLEGGFRQKKEAEEAGGNDEL